MAGVSLYRHFAGDGQLLYVGVSLNAIRRLVEHREASGWFGGVRRVEIEVFASREEVLRAERAAIKRERPQYNVQHRESDPPPKKKRQVLQAEVYEGLRARWGDTLLRESRAGELRARFWRSGPEDIFDRKTVAAVLYVSVSTLELWHRLGSGPPCERIGRKMFYRRAAFDTWVESKRGAAPRSLA